MCKKDLGEVKQVVLFIITKNLLMTNFILENEELIKEEAIKAEKEILLGKQYERNEERLEALIAFFKEINRKTRRS